MGDNNHEVIKVCLPKDSRLMSVVTNKAASCRERLTTFLKDGEGCLMPSAVIMENVEHNKNIESLRSEILDLQQKISNNINQVGSNT